MALLAKLRPCGPWRVGADSGDRLRVGRILHSDALYSALTRAFIELGELDAWLEATAMHPGGAQIRSSSCFPFVSTENGDALFLPPPESHWPPPDSLRIRWKSARYVPPTAIWQLLNEKPLVEEHWSVDGISECLLPVIRNVPAASPFRVSIRSRAAIDRLGQGIEPHQTACLEFSKGSGIWIAFSFASKEAESQWSPALKGALRLIADSGLGGERSSGWGRFESPEFQEGDLGTLLFGNRYRAPEEVTGHWLLSLFSPAADDAVDWQQGNYRVVVRTGRVESSSGWGAMKRANQMIAEGGVLVSHTPLKGVARDVAPAGFPHPVYRAGFALSIPIGKPRPQQQQPKPSSSSTNVVVDESLLESLAAPVAQPPNVPEPTPTTVPEPTLFVPESTPTIPEPTPATPEPTPTVPEPTPATPEPTPIIPEPTPATPEPTPTTPEPTSVIPEPTLAVPEPTSAVPEPTPAIPEPTPQVPELPATFRAATEGSGPPHTDTPAQQEPAEDPAPSPVTEPKPEAAE